MRVMTFNTANDFIAPAELIATIDRSGADIVGLEELSPRNADALETAPLFHLPHRFLHGEYFDGKGILSHYPLQSCERFGLPSGRTAIDARLHLAKQVAAVFVVHPPPPNYRQREIISRIGLADVSRILARVPADLPTLLLGDFNFIRPTRGYRLLQQSGFTDTFRAVGSGRGLTYPMWPQQGRLPLPRMLRLDYIWTSQHVRPIKSWVGAPTTSDHLPLLTDVELHEIEPSILT
jgi:endonuclease/exonuclease/phosphatase family metal-dependent hydrolase